jgi:nitrate/nitrite transport system substrate-binding protein
MIVNPQSPNIPEIKTVKLGLVAAMEAAPLLVAQRYFFPKYGLTEVELIDRSAWQTRTWEKLGENVELGSETESLDGGQFLSPLPELINEGAIGRKTPMYVLLRLNAQGVGISLGKKFQKFKITLDSASLQPILYVTQALGKTFKCAVSARQSSDELWLRYWLAAAGINPDAHLEIVVVPKHDMRSHLNLGLVDLICISEPWQTEIVGAKQGFTATTTGEIWENHPGSVFAMRAAWVDRYPKATQALLMAIMEAQMWCDRPENQVELCRIVTAYIYPQVKIPLFKDISLRQVNLKNLMQRIEGNFDYGDGRISRIPNLMIKFWSNQGISVSYPFKSHDTWFLTENIRWGMLRSILKSNEEVKEIVNAVNREDLWREAAQSLGVPDTVIPASTSRGIETFFDGIQFDPEYPDRYLQSLKIKS